MTPPTPDEINDLTMQVARFIYDHSKRRPDLAVRAACGAYLTIVACVFPEKVGRPVNKETLADIAAEYLAAGVLAADFLMKQ